MYLSLCTFHIRKSRKPYSFYPVIGDLLSTREQRKKVKIKKYPDRKNIHTHIQKEEKEKHTTTTRTAKENEEKKKETKTEGTK